jgi:protein-disulfide isomerase
MIPGRLSLAERFVSEFKNRKLILFFLAIAVIITAFPPLGVAQTTTHSSGKSSAATITSDQADAILQELKLIRAALEKNPSAPQRIQSQTPEPPKQVSISDAKERSLGRDDAPLVLVEFTDYECPFCRRFHQDTFSKLKSEFIDTGKLRFVSRDLPLSFHTNAALAAEATRCAGDQGKFWEMRESLASAHDLSHSSLTIQAKQIGLADDAFQKCIDNEKYQKAVREEASEANAISIVATPSFVLGRLMPDGKIQGKLLVGALPFSVMETAIIDLLGSTTNVGPLLVSRSKKISEN